jgi:hypothetical protein
LSLRSAETGKAPSLRLDLIGGEGEPPQILKSKSDAAGDTAEEAGETNQGNVPVFHPSDLAGRTFLMDEQEVGGVGVMQLRVSARGWLGAQCQGGPACH